MWKKCNFFPKGFDDSHLKLKQTITENFCFCLKVSEKFPSVLEINLFFSDNFLMNAVNFIRREMINANQSYPIKAFYNQKLTLKN